MDMGKSRYLNIFTILNTSKIYVAIISVTMDFARTTYIFNERWRWRCGCKDEDSSCFRVLTVRNHGYNGGVFFVFALRQRHLDLKAPSISCVLWWLISKGSFRWFQLQRSWGYGLIAEPKYPLHSYKWFVAFIPVTMDFQRITYICNDVCGWSWGWELGFMLFRVSRVRNLVDDGGVFFVAALGERYLDLKALSIFCVLRGLHLSKGTLRWFQLQRTLCWLFQIFRPGRTWIMVHDNYIDFTKLGRL